MQAYELSADVDTYKSSTTYIHLDDSAEEQEQETVIIDGVPRDAAWLEANARDFSLLEKEVATNLTEEISKLNVNLWTDVKPTDAAATAPANVRGLLIHDRLKHTYIHTTPCIDHYRQAYFIVT